MNASSHYDQGYHSEVHANLIGNEEYFKAVGEASKSLYLRGDERQLRVLDYGCGLGQLIDGLEHGAGFEVSEEARAHCLRRGLRVWGRLEDVPAGEWDVVIARHVLEHLESPLGALLGIQPLLAPRGTLILVLPREGHRPASLTPDVHQHLFCWNFRNINNLLLRAGYRPEINEYRYVRGFGVLMPLRKLPWLYLQAVQLAGRLVRNAELYVRARA